MKHAHLERQLVDAVLLRDRDTLSRLIEEGATPNARDAEHDATLLMLAAQVNDPVILELVLDAGADTTSQDDSGRTALFYASTLSPCFDILVARGADIHASDHDGRGLLVQSVSRTEGIVAVDKLLALGANPLQSDSHGETAADLADSLGLSVIADRLRHARAN